MQTAIQSVTNLGGMIGALYTGKLRRKGRWNVIIGINILLITSCLVCLIPNDTVLIIGRFFYGIACGAFTFICPKYIAEFAPLEIRGTLGGLTEVFVTVGAMIPFLLGPLYTPLADVTETNPSPMTAYGFWLLLFLVPVGISIIQVLILLFIFNFDTPPELF